MSEHINLGDTVRDTITGFEGVVIAATEFMYGCRRLSVQPKELKDGSVREAETFDELQLEVVEPTEPREPATTGGPRPGTKSRRLP